MWDRPLDHSAPVSGALPLPACVSSSPPSRSQVRVVGRPLRSPCTHTPHSNLTRARTHTAVCACIIFLVSRA